MILYILRIIFFRDVYFFFNFRILHPNTPIELLEHLVILPDPNPTLVSIFYKSRGILLSYTLFRFLLVYHVMSAMISLVAFNVPNVTEQRKKLVAEWF